MQAISQRGMRSQELQKVIDGSGLREGCPDGVLE